MAKHMKLAVRVEYGGEFARLGKSNCDERAVAKGDCHCPEDTGAGSESLYAKLTSISCARLWPKPLSKISTLLIADG
jgi:hypothetical protein